MKNNLFLGDFGEQQQVLLIDLILEHDHGKIQAAKLPSMHSMRQWVHMIF
jgi:hypothetical protein